MERLFDLVYLCLLVLAAPWCGYRRFRLGKRPGNLAEKGLGRLPPRDGCAPCVWWQAVSVGEVVQLQALLAEFDRQCPGCVHTITTTTTTGHEVARQLFPHHTVAYFPADVSWAVRAAFDRVRPALVVLVELEVWPNFCRLAARRGIPVVVVNGRISERSFPWYLRARAWLQPAFASLRMVLAQSDTIAERFRRLGVPASRVHVTGSIKFDRLEADRHQPLTREIRAAFGIGREERVFVAGSTQAPEEELALEAYRVLRTRHPELRLMLVPRHKERFAEVARLVRQSGAPLLCRTQVREGADAPRGPEPEVGRPPVLLLDTLGELAAAWGLADYAFVGGSLMRRGGQNMLEPAGYGAAVMFGPHTHNFRDVVALLLEHDAARVVHSGAELTAQLERWLAVPLEAQALGQRARHLVSQQRGATRHTVAALQAVLAEALTGTPHVAGHRKSA